MLPMAVGAAPLLPTRGELGLYLQRMEKVLYENIVPFWYPNTIDPAGGYLLNHDGEGKSKGPGVRAIVTQAQMVWFYARLARFGYEPKKMLEAAEHGYRFLRERMWDAKHGGFYWEVDAVGKPTAANKHLFGQSFGVLALAEYALASKRKDVREFALGLFQLLEKQAHDPVHGGYVEYFLSDWSTPPVNEPMYVAGSAAGMKLMSTHSHLMEAMTALQQATGSATVRDRLIELISIQSNAVVRKPYMASTDKYDRDWSPRLEGELARVNYGQDVAKVWLLIEANRAAGLPVSPYVDLLRSSFAYCRKYGFDEAAGGFIAAGGLGQPADDLSKYWWVEAEGLVSSLAMYQLTSNTEYFEVFRKTWGFCEKAQIDWAHGDWHATIDGGGKAQGDKAGLVKSAFHQGRAMIESLQRLRAIREKTS